MSPTGTPGGAMSRPPPRAEHAKQATDSVISLHQESPAKPPRDVRVQLQYLKDLDLYNTVKPLQITPNFADRERRTNIVLAPGEIETIVDVRGRDTAFSLDDHGFTYVKDPTMVKDWTSQPTIARDYLPEMERLLRREVEGCDEIIFYDARLRQKGDEGVRISGLSFNPFARQVHTDNTATSVIDKIHHLTDLKSDYLMSGRCRAINIWRPIKQPVYDCALAIAHGGKLQDGDVIECERRRHDSDEYWDTMGVIKYRPGFEWFYMSEQEEDDVLLFKNYDTATDVPARWCLHTAFDMPEDTIPTDAPTRESIEVRALVFTYPQNTTPPRGTSMQQPLVDSLERSRLMSYDTEARSIADRPRHDIDEGKEMKDAELLLRKQRIRVLERAIQDHEHQLEASNSKNDVLCFELGAAQKQVEAHRSMIGSLERQVEGLKRQYEQAALRESAAFLDSHLREQVRLHDEDDGLRWAREIHGPDAEQRLLRQTINSQKQEIERLKAEALGRAASSASCRVWQGTLDEALRRERVKDAAVVTAMRMALAKRGRLTKDLPHVTVDERGFATEAERDACEIQALQERLAFLLGQSDGIRRG